MIRLLVVVGLVLVIAFLLRTRPVIAISLVLTLWVVLPSVAVQEITGQSTGPVGIHPATWLVLGVLLVQLLFSPTPIASAVARHPLVVLGGTVFMLGAVWTSQSNGSGGIKLLFDQILAPMVLFLLVVAHARDRSALLWLRNTVLVLAAAQSLLSIVQGQLGRMIFYEADYETLYWFKPLKFDRWMGTTDAPLTLAYLLCVAAALSLSLRSVFLRFVLLGLYLVSVLITQSRTGVAIVCAVILYAVLRSRMVVWARALAAVTVLAGGYILVSSSLIAGFASRLVDDTGSADARQRALAFLVTNWTRYVLTGEGLTASYAVGRAAGLGTSLESSLLMYVVDVGLVLALLYFGTQLGLIVRNAWRHRLTGMTLAALVAFLLPQVSSALATSNLCGIVLWAALGMLVVARTTERLPRRLRYARGAPALISAATSEAS